MALHPCGRDQIFHDAQASIIGSNKITVRCPEVPSPVAARYAWANYPVANVYNREGFPLVPFRTDAFPPPPELKAPRP